MIKHCASELLRSVCAVLQRVLHATRSDPAPGQHMQICLMQSPASRSAPFPPPSFPGFI